MAPTDDPNDYEYRTIKWSQFAAMQVEGWTQAAPPAPFTSSMKAGDTAMAVRRPKPVSAGRDASALTPMSGGLESRLNFGLVVKMAALGGIVYHGYVVQTFLSSGMGMLASAFSRDTTFSSVFMNTLTRTDGPIAGAVNLGLGAAGGLVIGIIISLLAARPAARG